MVDEVEACMTEDKKEPEQEDDEYTLLQVEDSSNYLEQLDSEVSHLVSHHDYIYTFIHMYGTE